MKNQILSLAVLLVMTVSSISGQSSQAYLPLSDSEKQDQIDIAIKKLLENPEAYNLTQDDILSLEVTDIYRNKISGWTHLYMRQTYNGIHLRDNTITINIHPDKSIPYMPQRTERNIADKIDSDIAVVNELQAIQACADDLGFDGGIKPLALKRKGKFNRNFYTAPYAIDQIGVRPMYIKSSNGTYRLTWEVYLAEKTSNDTWYSYIDAADGSVLEKRNNTIKCQLKNGMFHNHTAECRHEHQTIAPSKVSALANADGAQYRVIPVPAESPIHGAHEIVVDPSIKSASPYGWHDTNGEVGAEYTITRGNNVWAYEDIGTNNSSSNNEPDGGDELIFDFPFNPSVAPEFNEEADVVNLFYMNNMMHDLTYLVGFDEVSGNFQENNYGNGGRGQDPVRAESLDGSGTNNANFSTPDDGSSGRMQMFKWSSTDIFRVTSPAVVSKDYQSSQGTWGMTPDYTQIDISAELAIALDGSSNPVNAARACRQIRSDVEGKIAIIRRGVCEFGEKALNAENAGAVAAIICNVPGVNGGDGETAMGMAAGAVGDQVTIPVISLAHSDCELIVAEMENGPVTAQLSNLSDGPGEVSSGFDNGVIAHEFGHGVSNRLYGGPSISGCLSNDEQPGEGISDFFALITSAEPGDSGADIRGIGNYADGQPVEGRGIRRFPFSTDIDACPLTLADILGTGDSTDTDPDNNGVHALGEVWAATLWDIYWEFTDLYGWTDDWSDGTAGNVRAIRLFMDAMKMAPCNPGYEDLRASTFAADNGEHTCLLWEVFARRGMGYLTDFGDSNERDDNVENFEPLPTCITTLKIKREVTDLITAGDILEIKVDIANHTLETATNVTVTDVIPDGLTIVPESTDLDYTVDGNDIVFNIGDMATLDEMTFTYQLQSDPNIESQTLMINQVETEDEWAEFMIDLEEFQGFFFWDRSQLDARSGNVSWFVPEVDDESDQRLIYQNLPIAGERPVLRFWHRPNCTPLENGGFVEYTTDGTTWRGVNDNFLFGRYNDPIVYANLALPGLEGFSGYNNDFRPAYLDLSFLNRESVDIRFRFATHDYDENIPLNLDRSNGWFVDDIEVLDLKTYLIQINISADNAETVYEVEQEIVVDSNGMSSSTDEIEGVAMSISPNPASEVLTVNLDSDRSMNGQLAIISIDGRFLYNQKISIKERDNYFNLKLGGIESGIYILQLSNADGIVTRKFVKK